MPNDEKKVEPVKAVAETKSTTGSLLAKANEQSTLGLKKTLTFSELPKKKDAPKED